jgi:NitT/TauT family transport system substrate-binding protein
LFLLTNETVTVDSIDDLNGKTIYTCKNGTPRIILQKILEAYKINATISYVIGEGEDALTINTPQDIPPVIIKNKAAIVLAPEPIVSTALSKPSAKHKVALDLSDVWDQKFDSPIAMGCIVVSKRFADEHPIAIENFLKEYKQSIEFMSDVNNLDKAADLVVKAGISDDPKIAKSALSNLGKAIAYVDGAEMKEALEDIYNIFGLLVIGGKLPEESFYYVK